MIWSNERKKGGEEVEIFEAFKYLSLVIFSVLVVLSIFGKTRDGYFLAAIIILGANFWTRIKLGENPNSLEYLIALALYVLAIIGAIRLKARKKSKLLKFDLRRTW